jgi:nitroimidazol reductase NimA-like FMN-containing flavoprotein (pyridoxamine 5'-phosphate oxidase superfamily)
MPLSDSEAWEFLAERCFGTLATVGIAGFPHLVSIGYIVGDGMLRMTSYEKAQKIVNIGRDAKISVLVEDIQPYNDIRGVLLSGEAEVVNDRDAAMDVMLGISAQMHRLHPETQAQQPAVDYFASSRKRVEFMLRPTRMVTWDHRQLEGRY